MEAVLALRPAHAVVIEPLGLQALLAVPPDAIGTVIFAHGSGSSRLSPRNNQVADALHEARLATLLLDLLTPAEAEDRANVFDIALLASRLRDAEHWIRLQARIAKLPVGYFGASTGAGAALLAASAPSSSIAAIVSRGGRPDLAGSRALTRVRAPTLLIVGERDVPVIALNRIALTHMTTEKDLVIVPGAHHLFEEPGALEQVVQHATRWFLDHMTAE